MKVDLKDRRCRTCGGQLTIVEVDDATMTVECIEGCGEGYLVEHDAFGDGCMTYLIGFFADQAEADIDG